jgi:uncharacterized protein YciI
MLFIVYCKDKSAALRAKLRADHLKHIIANLQPYHLGAPLIGPQGDTIGSLFLFDVQDRAHLERVMSADPYFYGGLFESVDIHPTRQIIPETAPGLLARELEKELEKQQRG